MTGAVEFRLENPVSCAVCSGAVTHAGDPAQFPYCRECYYSGRAYTHRLAGLADMFARETGGRLWVDQTGGGTQTVMIGPESGGWCVGVALVGPDDGDVSAIQYEAVGAWFYDDDPESEGCDVPGALELVGEYDDVDGFMSADALARYLVAVWPLIVDYAGRVGSVELGAEA